jgi:hypothetical protein
MSRPQPPVSAEVDLRGLEYMPLFGTHLFGSEFNARASDAAWRAAVTLWWAAWQQKPAGSLPNDDTALCRLADLGRDLKAWRAVREVALHGFTECADGRLYHGFLCEQALIAWDKRVKDRVRKAQYRAGLAAKDMPKPPKEPETGAGPDTGQDADVPRDTTGTGQGRNADVPADGNRRDGTGRDGTGKDVNPTPPPAPAGQSPAPQDAQPEAASSKATRLAEDWKLPEEWAADARQLAPMITDAGIQRTADTFADYWRGLGGAKARKVDWRATWRNWVRRENDRAPSIVRPMARVLALSSAGQATATALQGFVARGGRDHA